MLAFSVYIVLLFLGISASTSVTNSYHGDFNSRIKFMHKVQEVLASNKSYNLSPQCKTDYGLYKRRLTAEGEEGLWALRMFDAQAKIPSGIMDRIAADLGSFDECMGINVQIEQSKNIFGKYCLGTVIFDFGDIVEWINKLPPLTLGSGLTSPPARDASTRSLHGLQWATCLPHTYSADDIREIYSDIRITFSEEFCQTQPTQPEFDIGSIVITFFAFLLLLVAASTLYDTTLYYSERKSRHPMLTAFPALTNGKKLIAISNSPGQISCLHGIRVISTMWVILYHRIYIYFPMTNPADHFDWVSNPLNILIFGGTLVVDTCFAISGLVVTYSFLSASARGKRFNIILYYIYRYLRLTPVLAIVAITHITLLRYLGSGPIGPQTMQAELIDQCDSYLLRTLFYAQNYGDVTRPCVPQSWYLSADMQLFVLSPLLLIPLTKKPKLTLWITGLLAACSTMVSFVVAYVYELSAGAALTGDPEESWEFFFMLYYPTHTRAGPWLICIILGYFLFTMKKNKTKLVLNKKVLILVWNVTQVVLVACLYAGYDPMFGEYKRFLHSLLLALMRPVWTLGICAIIFLCTMGYGGIINWFLSMPLFEVLSKITYSPYLVHYTIIYMTSAQMRVTPKFSAQYTCNAQFFMFCADFIYTSAIALLLTMAVEFPVITIQNFVFGESKKKQSRPALNDNHVESGRI